MAGREVNVYHIHLPTNSVWPSSSDQKLKRTLPQRVSKRLGVRRDFLSVVERELSQRRGSVILAGDFNTSPRGELAHRLQDMGLSDSFGQAGRGFGFTHAAQLGHSRTDFVWTRGLQATQARALPEQLSDHRPLLACLGP